MRRRRRETHEVQRDISNFKRGSSDSFRLQTLSVAIVESGESIQAEEARTQVKLWEVTPHVRD